MKNPSLYTRVEQFVIRSFSRTGETQNIRHARRTVFWLKKLAPDADETLRIAAVAHDIERAFRDPDIYRIIADSPEGFMDRRFLKIHSDKGAEIIGDFLTRENASAETVERVKMLVAGHEFEGSPDQNLIKDADSLSNLETVAQVFIEHRADTFGREKVQAKFDWMLNRISSPEAREMALPMYRDAVRALEDKFRKGDRPHEKKGKNIDHGKA
jgi:hypothetical protein